MSKFTLIVFAFFQEALQRMLQSMLEGLDPVESEFLKDSPESVWKFLPYNLDNFSLFVLHNQCSSCV